MRDLINELKELNAGQRDGVSLNLQHISVKQAIKLIQQNIQDKKLAFKLENNKYYFLNDHTLDKLTKGLIDENAEVQHKVGGDFVQTSVSDAEYVSHFTDVKSLELIVVNTKKDKTKPGGGFFKYHHTTKFNLHKYGIFREDDEPDYSENCLVIAFRECGMSDEQLQMVKLFVMNRIVPKCKLKEICDTVHISIKLTSIRNDMSSRTEEFGDKKHPLYHIGLVDEHYFIIDKTDLTSYCLINYEDIKHLKNCNSIYMNTTGTYKTSNQKYIDSFKVVKILLENKDKFWSFIWTFA